MKFLSGKILIALTISICIGLFISLYSWDGVVYFFENDHSRIPASSQNNFDLNNIKSRRFYDSYIDIISKQTIFDESEAQNIYNLKNFHLQNKKPVCREYNKIQLRFIALNTAVNGEASGLNLIAPCIESKFNDDYISPIYLPKEKILNLSVLEKIMIHHDNQKIEFINIYDQWPENFRLQSVTFIDNTNNTEPLKVDLSKTKEFIDFSL